LNDVTTSPRHDVYLRVWRDAIENTGYPFNAGQLEDGHCDLKCWKACLRRLQL
jgi:hypothetical protein